jgi:hypothetical protein
MQFLHLLGIILCLVTLIGALGGSLRFQENFYEEVFDLVDSDEGFEEEIAEAKTEDTAEIQGVDESLITQAEVEQPAEIAEPVVAPEVEEEASEVEAYDQEEVYASI